MLIEAKSGLSLDANQIQKILPHRYPFLLLDRITDIQLPREDATQIEPGMKVFGIKNVTANEPFFPGHFPGNPIMPGVLIVEALAQCACCGGLILKDNIGKLGIFTGIEDMKFRKQVTPGDVLELAVEFMTFKHGMGKARAVATVDGAVAAEGIIKFAMVTPE
ncbi:MAG TPA: 3-hydroxyacyl-ACP dehydratase FabZ [Thermoclostridium caenicola]|uniref:3-hydroxyacyl-[acyl-carrier-protein] dehydratase FabZ n=1 Tax=Thermoclostridium caenicola TaxID=659425 RepID=A0A1M6BHD2_9FIRM|nr:3-hydroxyacyl-ACP dehydratase FabZ [Thermoclostridium caenicola]SHI48119.1 3-hydroxyacyl-[acyl-carrier-protein] dehydratase [Thermoclostridium caenicola]HOK43686.1 3-hydroxyacyl-ACP dehydratase FabZ [Thermoclostridium caenicola]HOL84846.1 3-hydroxyacyl-ACP dehydratase FabZ [Thermoclostridium caenicola]HPO76470.1 3-hydroxyacyl-ACP dehydratase FabZ [Thermoclostridium caenicola]HPU22144.1 3-hydroxyacyl-ACP dehydratase FabZ [Thermoclostridium caenicola]